MLYLCGECVCTCWVHLKKIQGHIYCTHIFSMSFERCFRKQLRHASGSAIRGFCGRPGLACCDCGKSWTWRTLTFFGMKLKLCTFPEESVDI